MVLPLICLDHLSACYFCALLCRLVFLVCCVCVSLCLLLCIVCVSLCVLLCVTINNNNNNNNNNTDARSYLARSPRDVLCSAEGEKKRKYMQACQNRRATFTPLCVSVDGMLGSEAEFFVKRLSDFLAARWERPYSVVMGWVRARLSFAILRAALLCVCGSR